LEFPLRSVINLDNGTYLIVANKESVKVVVIIGTVKNRVLNFVALIYYFSYKAYPDNSIVDVGRGYFRENDGKARF